MLTCSWGPHILSPKDAATTVCMPLHQSKGINPVGLYFNVLLGFDAGGAPVAIGAHRLVCWLCRGAPRARTRAEAAKCLACHRCSTRGCINPVHLYWGSAQDNADDVVRCRASIREHLGAISPTKRPAPV